MSAFHNNLEIKGVYYGLVAFKAIYRNLHLLWELILGFIFTKNGRPIRTSNKRMIRCKNQK